MTKEERILAECSRRGLTVMKVGKAWRIVGKHTDITVRLLTDIDLHDLNPRIGEKRRTPAQ